MAKADFDVAAYDGTLTEYVPGADNVTANATADGVYKVTEHVSEANNVTANSVAHYVPTAVNDVTAYDAVVHDVPKTENDVDCDV